MKKFINGIFVFLFCAFYTHLCFGTERMPERIDYFADSADGKVKITYALNKLEQNDMNDIEKTILSLLQNNKRHKFNNIALARYTSRNSIMGWQVTPDLAPVDVICVDYENNWFIRDIRRDLREELFKNTKIIKLSEQELIGRIRELHEYDIEFLYYDAIGIAKGAGEVAFLIKDNSLIIFYYRYSWLEPIKQLAKQINTATVVNSDKKK